MPVDRTIIGSVITSEISLAISCGSNSHENSTDAVAACSAANAL